MKNLITALSVLTLGTTVGNLTTSYNANQNTKTVNTILNQDMKKINNNINLTTINNSILKSLTKNKVQTVAGGENYYHYYAFYDVIGLDHALVNKLNNAIGSGIGLVGSILSGALPALAPIVGIVAALLIAQWYIWDIPSYDNGNGVVLGMIGGLIAPTIIVSVSAQ